MYSISALHGDNIVKPSTNMNWYKGPSILSYLENVKINEENDKSLRLPVQYVLRTTSDFRGYCGRIASGEIYTGKKIKIYQVEYLQQLRKSSNIIQFQIKKYK